MFPRVVLLSIAAAAICSLLVTDALAISRVRLTSGYVVEGTIVERLPNGSVKVILVDGSIRVLGGSEIAAIDGPFALPTPPSVDPAPEPALSPRAPEPARDSRPPPESVAPPPARAHRAPHDDDGEPKATGKRSKLYAAFQGMLSAGAYFPIDEIIDAPAPVFGPGIRGDIGYRVTPDLAIGATLEFSPAAAVGDAGVAVAPQGYFGPVLTWGGLDGAGPQLAAFVGFGGHGAIGVYGGYGPAFEPSVRYVFDGDLATIVGASLLLGISTRDALPVGVQFEAAFTAGFQN